MPHVLDQSADLDGRELYRLTRNNPLPPFCKTASSADMLNGAVYAYPSKRLYPCGTAAATYISSLFFFDKEAGIPENARGYIESQLQRYASYHGISERFEELRQKMAKQAAIQPEDVLDDDDFALLMDGERHYPMRNGKEVQAAAGFMAKNKRIIPLEYRQKMASRILAKADQFGADLSEMFEELEKTAGHGFCSAEAAATFLFNRARLLKAAGHLDTAIQVAGLAKSAIKNKVAVHDNAQLCKLASLIDRIDRETGINRYYTDLPAPEDELFALTTTKVANFRAEHVSTITGNIYKRADLGLLALDDIRDYMGDEFATAVSDGGLFVNEEKLAAIVPTLPLRDSRLFDRMVSAAGAAPVAKEAAHHAPEGFSTEELAALATMVEATAVK